MTSRTVPNNPIEINWRVVTLATGAIFLSVLVFPLIGFGLVEVLNSSLKVSSEVILTIVLLFGMITLFAVLNLIVITLAALNLTDSKEALGLPRGTIRAIIALLLLVMFVIIAVFLYRQLAVDDKDASVRFAEQVLTTISTLVVSIASFYFGTKAVETASGLNPDGNSGLKAPNAPEVNDPKAPDSVSQSVIG
jgi:hypothetical protein